MTDNPRIYGTKPFSVAVVHGGPGAGGEMAPVARMLARERGVLEPLQTAMTLDGQVEELALLLGRNADLPVTLVGYSWGAWLCFITAARRAEMVRKLILVSSGPFEEKYTAALRSTRMGRLSESERAELATITRALGDPAAPETSTMLKRLGTLASKADSYDPVLDAIDDSDLVGLRGDVNQGVWNDAAELRRNGGLLDLARYIQCPVVAIHGDFDPHPAEGVEKPLAAALADFRFALLERCGHTPWLERQARDDFYRVLSRELG